MTTPEGRPVVPRVSAVIVNWNARDVLLNCLQSLADNPPSCAWEAIVIDNASHDGSVEAVRNAFGDVRVIANPTNRGLAAANNQGMLAARGEVFLICNPDVLFRPGAIDAMLGTLDRHPRSALVIPRLIYEDGELQTSVGSLPSLADALLGRQILRLRRNQDTSIWWDGWAHDTEREIGRGYECAYLARRIAAEEVGLQDEGFILDWEGPDWTARLHDGGWEAWFCPDASIVHLGGASIRQIPFRSLIRAHRGMYRYFAKRHPAARPLLAAAFGVRAVVKMGSIAVGAQMYERAFRKRT